MAHATERRDVQTSRESASHSGGFEAVVLVVDADAVSRKFVELALVASEIDPAVRVTVETANHASGALTVLKTSRVDLIISESDLTEMSVGELLRRINGQIHSNAVPLIVLSADDKKKTRYRALAQGALDFLSKPCDPIELRLRVVAILRRQRQVRHALLSRDYILAGDFEAIPFPDLVGILGIGQRTGILSVVTRASVGKVYFREGQVVHSTFGNLTGHEAFYAILGESAGRFEFSASDDWTSEFSGSISESVSELIMEGARVLDTRQRTKTSLRPSVAPRDTRKNPASIVSAPLGGYAVATHFAQGLSDPFALAESHLLGTRALDAWTMGPEGVLEVGRSHRTLDSARLHCVVLADLAEGLASFLPLMSEPTESWVFQALSEEPKALVLSFRFRAERVLDLVLLDIRNAARFQSSLRRQPSIVLIAPPQGDLLTIGTRAVVELDHLLGHLAPTLLATIGQSTLEMHVRDLSSVRERSLDVQHVPGRLGGAGIDLREVFGSLLKVWAEVTAVAMARSVQ